MANDGYCYLEPGEGGPGSYYYEPDTNCWRRTIPAGVGYSTDLNARVGALEESVGILQVVRASTSLTLTTSAEWKDLDPTGTVLTRDLDLVIPGLVVGDGFTCRPTFSVNTGTGIFELNVAVIVGGAVQRRLFPDAFGHQPWSALANVQRHVEAETPRMVVEEGDLENGSLRLRLQYTVSSSTRVVGSEPAFPLWFEGRAPLGRGLA